MKLRRHVEISDSDGELRGDVEQIQLVGHDAVRDAYVACHRAQFVNSVSQKHLSPEENLCFLKLFSQRLRNLSKILHSYCMFISAPSYKILFNYR